MITDAAIEKYITGLLPERDPVLLEMEEEAARRDIPIIGPVVGNFLAVLVRLSGARRIFELGSAIGYSTIWLARAAGPGAEVHYTDGNPANALQARRYFERAGVANLITIHVGDALQELAATPGTFDFLFNDIDKEGYPAALRQVPPRLRSGGLFVTDNALWHERVLKPEDAAAQAVVQFNRDLFASRDLATTLVPIRDGVTVSVKLS